MNVVIVLLVMVCLCVVMLHRESVMPFFHPDTSGWVVVMLMLATVAYGAVTVDQAGTLNQLAAHGGGVLALYGTVQCLRMLITVPSPWPG